MKEKRAYWIGGTLTALLGVGFVRLLAPALAGLTGSIAGVAGYLLVIVGITVVALATRRTGSEAFATIEKAAED
jgi:protein-S-isoprenylcysteine O-methyltransferase Ste14